MTENFESPDVDRGKFDGEGEQLTVGIYRLRDTDTGKLIYYSVAEGFVSSIEVVDE